MHSFFENSTASVACPELWSAVGCREGRPRRTSQLEAHLQKQDEDLHKEVNDRIDGAMAQCCAFFPRQMFALLIEGLLVWVASASGVERHHSNISKAGYAGVGEELG